MTAQQASALVDRIGPYRVVTTIGAGGMGQVLKVQDTRTSRYLAMKIHYSPTDKDAVLLSYRREHRAMSRCDHPNVLRCFESGVHEGHPYLVMEFVDGVPLTDFLAERGLEPGPERDKMAALLGIQIASALDHIHSRNLVHLDLKPANILVTPDERVKLIDFGIARDLEADKPRHPSGGAIGTYAFCSPEQVTGAPCDHRSDLYSFGVVLYLLITGKLPFVAEETIAYILKHVNEPPVPLETYYPQVPPLLRDIVLKLLAKSPLERPQSGREVERVLKAFVEEAWRKEGRAAPKVVPAETPREVRLFEPAFVGRENGRRRLAGSISLLQAGVGGIDLIIGETGVGKGQLMNDALSGARARGIPVFLARCYRGGAAPFYGLVELLDAIVAYLLRREVNLLQVELGTHLPVLARAFPPVAKLLPAHAAEVQDASPRVERERLREALLAFLDAVLPGPTVLALREVQWADPASLELIEAVALRRPGDGARPCLFVGTVSTGERRSADVFQRWKGSELLELLELAPLTPRETGMMIDSMLGGHIDLGRIGTMLYRETGGLPLRILEAVRMMVDRGDLSPHSVTGDEISGWTLVVPDETDTLDEIARATRDPFLERVALLPETPRRLLAQMAVWGCPCSYPWLRVVTPVSEDELLDILDLLLARRILVELPGVRHSLFAFYHPWMVDVLRDSLDPDERKRLHRSSAEAWLTVHGETDGHEEMIARHLLEGEAFEAAAPRLLRAAETRFRLGLHETSRDLLEKALQAARRAPDRAQDVEARAHYLLGLVQWGVAPPEQVAANLRTAAARAEEAGNLELQGRALAALADVSAGQGDFKSASVQYGEAVKLLRSHGDQEGLVAATIGLATSAWHQGDGDTASRLFTDASIAANKLNDARLASRAVHGLGLVALHECRLKHALKHFKEAEKLSLAGGRDTFHLQCRREQAQVHAMTGDLVTAMKTARHALEALKRAGDKDAAVHAMALVAAVALELRDLKAARDQVHVMNEALKIVPNRYHQCMKQILSGQLSLVRGKAKMAQVAFGEAVEQARGGGYALLEARAERHLGTALIHAGALRDGILAIRRSLHITEKRGDVPGMLEARLLYAEGLVVRGDREEAWEVLSDIRTRLQAAGLRLLLVRTLALSARLASLARKSALVHAHVQEAFRIVHDLRKDMDSATLARFDTRPEIRLLVSLRRD